MEKVCFYTLGCKVNQYDTQAMRERFLDAGFEEVAFPARADVYVVNTCTVTETGDQKSEKLVRRMRRLNPDADVIVAGCLAQRLGEGLRSTGARLILGTQRRAEVVTLLRRARAEGVQLVAVGALTDAPYEPLFITRHEGHTRAVMKIQEGCDARCAYCVIPSVRGPVRSRPPEDIAREAAALAGAGFREIVLTGIHLTSYGRDFTPRGTLIDAIRAVQETAGVCRVRLGSLEPNVADDAFVAALRGMDKVCPQFHLALQSGSDAVLRRMRRRYSTAQYRADAARLRAAFPQASFTTDVMCGFPGETDAEFAETLAFVREIGFLKLHVFPYSEREGTEAAAMPDAVPQAVRHARAARLIAAGEEMARAFRTALLGQTRDVLLEETLPDGGFCGYTPEYVRVEIALNAPNAPDAPNARQSLTCGQIARVRLTGLLPDGMSGEAILTA